MSGSGAQARTVGVFGGSFDPVHFGHLRTALELKERLELGQVRFLPCALPPHRDAPIASASLRVRMLRAAVEAEPAFVVDTRELTREGPSYTIDTLASLREEFADGSLVLMLGLDAFASLPTWHRWTSLLELAHIVVARRPGSAVPSDGPLGRLLSERRTEDLRLLASEACGAIVVQSVTQLEISSTELRDSIRAGVPPRYLMPEAVGRIVLDVGCYAEKAT